MGSTQPGPQRRLGRREPLEFNAVGWGLVWPGNCPEHLGSRGIGCNLGQGGHQIAHGGQQMRPRSGVEPSLDDVGIQRKRSQSRCRARLQRDRRHPRDPAHIVTPRRVRQIDGPGELRERRCRVGVEQHLPVQVGQPTLLGGAQCDPGEPPFSLGEIPARRIRLGPVSQGHDESDVADQFVVGLAGAAAHRRQLRPPAAGLIEVALKYAGVAECFQCATTGLVVGGIGERAACSLLGGVELLSDNVPVRDRRINGCAQVGPVLYQGCQLGGPAEQFGVQSRDRKPVQRHRHPHRRFYVDAAGPGMREAKLIDDLDEPLMGGGLVRCLQRRRGLRGGGREVLQMPALRVRRMPDRQQNAPSAASGNTFCQNVSQH